MIIRKAILKDLSEVKNLNQELFNHDSEFDETLCTKWPSKNKSYYKEKITKKSAITFVAEEDGIIIGYLIGSMNKTLSYRKIRIIAELENMFVKREFRGKGIGKSLINNFKKWANSKGAKKARVVAYTKNNRALKVYEKNGFEQYCSVLELKL